MAAWHELSDTDAEDAEGGAPVACVCCVETIGVVGSSSGQPAICNGCGDKIKSGGYVLVLRDAAS